MGVNAGPCVVNVYINYEKKFAFVEFRTGKPLILFVSARCTTDQMLHLIRSPA